MIQKSRHCQRNQKHPLRRPARRLPPDLTETPTTAASQTPTLSSREIAQATLDQESTLAAEFTAIAAENQQTLDAAQSQTAAAWTDTPTPTPTATDPPTATPTLMPTATNTVDPASAPIAIFPAEEGVPLLASPEETSFATSTVFADFAESLPILGISDDGQYYQVQFFQRTGWINADLVEVAGDLGLLTGEQAQEVAAAEVTTEYVLYANDFESDNALGFAALEDVPFGEWEVITEEDGNRAYRGTTAPQTCPVPVIGSPRWEDYSVDLRFKFEEGDYLEVIVRAQDFNNYYAVIVGNGVDDVIIARKRQNQWINLLEGRYRHNANDWNELNVEVDGNDIQIRVNGQLYPSVDTSAFGDTFDTGYAGVVFCPTSQDTPTTILLDDVQVLSTDLITPDVVAANAEWSPLVQDFNGVEMVLVPPGCFMMGSSNGDEDEAPPHQQCFDEPFWLDRFEVTNGQFEANGGVSQRDPSRIINNTNLPRTFLTWFEARDYCQQLGGRLPTEPEWEYASRGPDSWVFPWGDVFIPDNANCGDCTDGPTELVDVGSWPSGASWVGALDMSGNASEWVSSMLEVYPYSPDPRREDMENDEMHRAFRGGAFGFGIENIRASDRSSNIPQYADRTLGVRCARDFTGDEASN